MPPSAMPERSENGRSDPREADRYPHSLACAAGLDEEWFPCKPDAPARESVLHIQQNRSNPRINGRDTPLSFRTGLVLPLAGWPPFGVKATSASANGEPWKVTVPFTGIASGAPRPQPTIMSRASPHPAEALCNRDRNCRSSITDALLIDARGEAATNTADIADPL